ncbi:uncharacterized protein [Antedon mediterranea]|uniref:uncharacterized protein n=1 Tax=Antedon mediterranea TaxID=105859 RepID=UPI003AF82E24
MDTGIATRMMRGEEDSAAGATTESWNYHWFYSVYIIVLITITILPLIGIGSFLFVYPSYIIAFVMFILVAYCQKRASQEPSLRDQQTSHVSVAPPPPNRPQEPIGRMSFSYFVATRPSRSSYSSSERLSPCRECFYDRLNSRRCVTSGITDLPPSYGEVTSSKIRDDDDTDSIPPTYDDVMAAMEEPTNESLV